MEITDTKLTGFLTSGRLITEASVSWGDMPLKFAYYLSSLQPPVRYVSSVRAIVFRDDTVLVVTDKRNQFYILPGGRKEKNETPEETLRREVLEETGWTPKELSLLGFIHFHHLEQKPADYEYPYPDFIWPVYISEADIYTQEAVEDDDYVLDSRFYPISDALELGINEGEKGLLRAAIKNRQMMKGKTEETDYL